MRQGLRSLTEPCDGRKGAKLPGWGLRAERALWGRRSPLVTGCSRSSHWPAPRWRPARILPGSQLPRGPPAQTVPGSEKSGDSLRGAQLRTEGTRGPGGAGSFSGPRRARARPPGPSPFPGLPPPFSCLEPPPESPSPTQRSTLGLDAVPGFPASRFHRPARTPPVSATVTAMTAGKPVRRACARRFRLSGGHVNSLNLQHAHGVGGALSQSCGDGDGDGDGWAAAAQGALAESGRDPGSGEFTPGVSGGAGGASALPGRRRSLGVWTAVPRVVGQQGTAAGQGRGRGLSVEVTRAQHRGAAPCLAPSRALSVLRSPPSSGAGGGRAAHQRDRRGVCCPERRFALCQRSPGEARPGPRGVPGPEDGARRSVGDS